jgi:hypothetical protein
MRERTLVWKDATLDEGRLTVPIVPAPDDEWRIAFDAAISMREHEARQQVYSRCGIENAALFYIDGTDSGALEPTADFFDLVIALANKEMIRSRSEHALRPDAGAEDREVSRAQDKAALEELRKRA